MHEINNVNRRNLAVKRFSNYLVIALVVGVLAAVIVLAAAGYDIDRSTGQVIQNGILLIETDPEGAKVTINDFTEGAQTPARYPIPAGEYNLMVEKEGYRPWQSPVEVIGSQVSWIYYPKLVPQVINTTQVNNVDGLNFIAANESRNEILVNLKDGIRSLLIFDMGAEEPTANPFVIPEEVFETDEDDSIIGAIKLLDWSVNGRLVALEYRYDKQTDIVIVDLVEPANSFNIDRDYDVEPDEVIFTENDSRLFLLIEGEVYEVETNAAVIGDPIDESVSQLVVTADNEWLVKTSKRGTTISSSRNIESLTIDSDIADGEVRYGEWDGQRYFLIEGSDRAEIYINSEEGQAEQNIVDKVLQLDGIKQSDVAPGGRFVSLYAADETLVYDLETLKTHEIPLGSSDNIGWLDGHRLHYALGDQLRIIDFNGFNDYQIASYNSDYSVFVDDQFNSIYSIANNRRTDQLVLRQSVLRISE
jgi:hypothetical protein